MSGDWIKMRVGLLTHPKVIRMASALKADRFRIVGGMLAVWSVFDQHSADGRLDGYTTQLLDDAIGWRGFSGSMAAIGWLEVDDEGLTAPEFEEHNSASAKRRASETKRKKNDRGADKTAHGSWTESGQMSASKADKSLEMSADDAEILRTREEQEKKKKPPNPRQRGDELPPGFEAFWTAFPRKTAKPEAVKAWSKLDPDDPLQAALLKAVDRQRRWPSWTKDGGQFIPHPSTWLNQRRWEDEQATAGASSEQLFEGAH